MDCGSTGPRLNTRAAPQHKSGGESHLIYTPMSRTVLQPGAKSQELEKPYRYKAQLSPFGAEGSERQTPQKSSSHQCGKSKMRK